MKTESTIQREIMIALNGRDDCRVFRNQVGSYKTPDGGFIKYGLGQGSPDLIGFLKRDNIAVFLGIECKRPGCKPTEAQKRWIKAIQKFGGVAGVATSVDDALNIIK